MASLSTPALSPASTVAVPVHELRAMLQRIFSHFPLLPADIQDLCNHLIVSELLGKPSHGVVMIVRMVRKLAQHTRQRAVHWAWRGTGRLHGAGEDHAGYLVVAEAMQRCVARMQKQPQGAVIASLSNISHAGRLGHYTVAASQAGYIAFVVAHSMPALAAPGHSKAVLGSNVLAVSIPFTSPPIHIDMTPNAITMGAIRLTSLRGEALPEGIALDGHGHPTTDPNAVLQGGAVLAAGGHKGFVLALLLNVLAVMAGGAPLPTVRSGYGYLLGVLDPNYLGHEDYQSRVQSLLMALCTSPVVHVPGQDYDAVTVATATAVPLPSDLLTVLQTLTQTESITDLLRALDTLPAGLGHRN